MGITIGLGIVACVFFAWAMTLWGENKRLRDGNLDLAIAFSKSSTELIRENTDEQFELETLLSEALPTDEWDGTERPLALAKLVVAKVEELKKQLREARRELELAEQIMKDDKAAATTLSETIDALKIAHTRDLADAVSREADLRRMLAGAYAGAGLYGDDGEMQDNRERPFIDFLRDTVKDIESKIQDRGMAKIRAAGNVGVLVLNAAAPQSLPAPVLERNVVVEAPKS